MSLLLLGALLGCVGTGYIKAFVSVQQAWATADGTGFPTNTDSLQFGAGNVWWIGVGAAAGLTVGCLRALFNMDEIPTFLDELRQQHVDPWHGVRVAILAVISLMGGASVGPEAGLGAAGGACGELLNMLRGWWMAQRRKWCARKDGKPPPQEAARTPAAWYAARVVDTERYAYDDAHGGDTRRRLAVVAGMAGGFACFLPSPVSAVLLTAEIGHPPGTWGLTYPRLVVGLALSATSAFIVYYAFNKETYLNPQMFVLGAINSSTDYNQISVVIGALFGIMGAALAVVYVLVGGVMHTVMAPLRAALDARAGVRARMVLLGTLGGTIMGALSYACPLVIGDGSWQVSLLHDSIVACPHTNALHSSRRCLCQGLRLGPAPSQRPSL